MTKTWNRIQQGILPYTKAKAEVSMVEILFRLAKVNVVLAEAMVVVVGKVMVVAKINIMVVVLAMNIVSIPKD